MSRVNAPVPPTLPSFPAVFDLGPDRAALLAGLSFVEGAGGWSRDDLGRWFQTYSSALGRDTAPPAVWESAAGGPPLPLDGPTSTRPAQLPRVLAMARWQVILTLRGLLANPPDDRFLHAAIFSGRVRRGQGNWLVVPREDDPLSQVVLALFAADILTYREFHEQNLCVCDVCGRISYDPRATTRAGCADHVPATEAASGVQSRGAK